MTDTAALRALAEATSTTGLDEAIEHTTSVARDADGRCSVEHLQLAEWLTFVESIHPVVISLCDRVDALEAAVTRLRSAAAFAHLALSLAVTAAWAWVVVLDGLWATRA